MQSTFEDRPKELLCPGLLRRLENLLGRAGLDDVAGLGAGDAFLSVTSPIVAAGASMQVAGMVGNAVGAMKVGIVGHRRSVERAPTVKFLTALLK